MKVAIVHDWLNYKVGGAERVLLKLAELFPEAPIYTLVYSQAIFGDLVEPACIRTSRLQRLPRWLKKRSRYLLPLIPKAIENFDLSGYDVVISSSSAFSKNVITRPETLHICYCHTPMRFAWDYWPAYLDEQRVGGLRKFIIRRLVSQLRVWDYVGAARVDKWVANSKTTQQRIKKYYHQPAIVINPPVATKAISARATVDKDNYYVTLSVLSPYKKLDLAIEAFNISGESLKIIGSGSDEARLRSLAKPNIEFLGQVDEPAKLQLLAKAKALIFPLEEDFGIAPVEAMAAGTPVVAYSRGGATETVIEGKTGIFFSEQTESALNKAVAKAARQHWQLKDLQAQANQFDEAVFAAKLHRYVSQAYQDYVKAN